MAGAYYIKLANILIRYGLHLLHAKPELCKSFVAKNDTKKMYNVKALLNFLLGHSSKTYPKN